ncbi:DUF1471 domain-containing protein [Enterobacter sp. 63]
MKSMKIFATAAAISLVSFASVAQSVTAIGSTLDDAQAQIVEKAKQAGASYHITEAYTGDHVHMTAELTK